MCGIAGIVGASHPERVSSMVAAMRHRGPDDSGIFSEEGIAMGMSRLAIIDLSSLGHQPMRSHCGRYQIVYNGECYNFKEIRSTLQSLGDQFTSDSDTEVVLQAYVRWGKDCLQKLNGMFAFAIWDTQEKSLFAARDHMGIKPFYYGEQSGNFYFASEVKTLLVGGFSDTIDEASVFQYFTFGYIQQPATILKGVKVLLPGHCLILKNKEVTLHQYWTITSPLHKIKNYEEAKDELRNQIRKSTQLQLISDRPLGLFLSGGLDSAVVLASMSENGSEARTFSIGFEDNPYVRNETAEALELAKHFGAVHTSVNLDAAEVISLLPQFFNSLDQPSVDGLNTFLVSKYAAQSMTVALSGLGGDELFAGYSRHARLLWKSQHHGLQWLSRLTPLQLAIKISEQKARWLWKSRAYGESDDFLLNYTIARTLTFPTEKGLLKKDIQHSNVLQQYKDVFKTADQFSGHESSLDRILKIEAKTFMSSLLLRDMDATSMANSMEVRFPLLDKNLIDFAFRLPDQFKLDPRNRRRPRGEGLETYKESGAKKILLEAMESLLPKGFSEKRKNGFKLPINSWLRKMDARKMEAFIFDQQPIWEPFCHVHRVRELYQSYLIQSNNDQTFWKLISFIGTMAALKESASKGRKH